MTGVVGPTRAGGPTGGVGVTTANSPLELSGTTLSLGTVPAADLPGDVCYVDQNNAFTGTQLFNNISAIGTISGTFSGNGSALTGVSSSASSGFAKSPGDPTGGCSSTNAGQIYFNTTDNTFRGCNGTSFALIGGAPGAGLNPSVGPVQTFLATGGPQPWIVPAGVTSLSVKLWGAGGGGTGYSGGAGGFVTGTISVTPGETLTIVVGGGGAMAGGAGYGGGGSGGIGSAIGAGVGANPGAGGGGRSAIIRASSTELITAGGGGGSALWADETQGGTGGSGGQLGGAGSVSCPGGTVYAGGQGGTQAAGGAPGQNSQGATGTMGGPLQGGNGAQAAEGSGSSFGGGGGGGWFGGGGGTGGSNGTSCSNGGGGGSSYLNAGQGVIGSMAPPIASINSIGSAPVSPPNTGDSDYLTGVGVGGGLNQDGGPGYVVIRYAGTIPTAPSITNTGVMVFHYSGNNQSFQVPAGVTAILVKAWGAAGAGVIEPANGGPGGYTTAVVAVTPGETLNVIVGGGGHVATESGAGGFGGGAPSGPGTGSYWGGGGGRSALQRAGTELLTAGGGGGAAAGGATSSGGAGGGSTGGVGTSNGPADTNGGGGAQTAGGAGGSDPGLFYPRGQAGSSLTGGSGAFCSSLGYYGGGGGGGYYGGGGGAAYCSGQNECTSGGGGSGYVGGPGVFGTIYPASAAGSSGPPNTSDPDYANSAGQSGTGDGYPGLVVIRW